MIAREDPRAPDGLAAARSLYASLGFADCGPFAGYPGSPNSHFMTLAL